MTPSSQVVVIRYFQQTVTFLRISNSSMNIKPVVHPNCVFVARNRKLRHEFHEALSREQGAQARMTSVAVRL